VVVVEETGPAGAAADTVDALLVVAEALTAAAPLAFEKFSLLTSVI
jgi:hypothetical protein